VTAFSGTAARSTGFEDGDWHALASCRGESTETFYPPDRARGNARRLSERRAKQICESCPVLLPCRRYAVDAQEPHGIWGGTTPEERGLLRRGGSLS
jgi:WhiB family redox-sensing transcriptional regulator